MIRKAELDRATITDTGFPDFVVRQVTVAFIDAVRDAIVRDGAVHLDTLGTFKINVHKRGKRMMMTGSLKKGVRGPMREVGELLIINVGFKKANLLRRELSKQYVEGVEQDEQLRKRRNDKARSGRKRRRGGARKSGS